MSDIRFKLDPDTKLINIAKTGHSCTEADIVKSESPRHRIYWEELNKPYVPQAESISYLNDDGEMVKMELEITEKLFTRFHDQMEMGLLFLEFQEPIGVRSI